MVQQTGELTQEIQRLELMAQNNDDLDIEYQDDGYDEDLMELNEEHEGSYDEEEGNPEEEGEEEGEEGKEDMDFGNNDELNELSGLGGA